MEVEVPEQEWLEVEEFRIGVDEGVGEDGEEEEEEEFTRREREAILLVCKFNYTTLPCSGNSNIALQVSG